MDVEGYDRSPLLDALVERVSMVTVAILLKTSISELSCSNKCDYFFDESISTEGTLKSEESIYTLQSSPVDYWVDMR